MGRLKVYAVGPRFGKMPRQYGGSITGAQELMMDRMIDKGLRLGYNYGRRKVRRKIASGVARARGVYKSTKNNFQNLLRNLRSLQKGGRVKIAAPNTPALIQATGAVPTTTGTTSAKAKRNHRSWSDVLWGMVNSDVANAAVSNFGNRMGEEAVNKAFGAKPKPKTKRTRTRKKKKAASVQKGAGIISSILAGIGL